MMARKLVLIVLLATPVVAWTQDRDEEPNPDYEKLKRAFPAKDYENKPCQFFTAINPVNSSLRIGNC
jgi:hypothetical protein